MHHFNYKNGVLHAEQVSLAEIAENVGTPFYCYSTATLERHYNVFAKSVQHLDAQICYALKANSNLAVLKTLANLGAGMDVVSEGELRRARAKSGFFDSSRIFHLNGLVYLAAPEPGSASVPGGDLSAPGPEHFQEKCVRFSARKMCKNKEPGRVGMI